MMKTLLPIRNFIMTRWAQRNERRLIKQATHMAYSRWAKSHPEWVVAFFDEHFVTYHVAPMLTTAIEGQHPLDPHALAVRWADQLHFTAARRQGLIATLLPALADFLTLFRAELNRQPTDHARWLWLWQNIDEPCTDCN
jgi:hypothetical protein